MNKQAPPYNYLTDDTRHRLSLYKSLLGYWVFRHKQPLTVYKMSEILDIPAGIIIDDLSACMKPPATILSVIDIDSVHHDIDHILGRYPLGDCLLVGVGRLGSSLLKNNLITDRIKVVAAFDIRQELIGGVISGLKIQDMGKLYTTVKQLHLKLALIATTPENTRMAMSLLLEAGISLIWNFTSTILEESPGIKVQNTGNFDNIEADYLKLFSRG